MRLVAKRGMINSCRATASVHRICAGASRSASVEPWIVCEQQWCFVVGTSRAVGEALRSVQACAAGARRFFAPFWDNFFGIANERLRVSGCASDTCQGHLASKGRCLTLSGLPRTRVPCTMLGTSTWTTSGRARERASSVPIPRSSSSLCGARGVPLKEELQSAGSLHRRISPIDAYGNNCSSVVCAPPRARALDCGSATTVSLCCTWR